MGYYGIVNVTHTFYFELRKDSIMKKKWKIIFPIIVVIILIGYIMTFPKWLFPNLYPTYIETIERNWGISLPVPDNKETIYNTRGGFHGDGEAITVLVYN